MNALFELPDEGFEDHLVHNESLYPLLSTAKDAAKRTLGRYYGAINDFIACQATEKPGNPAWSHAKRHLEHAALDIQHAYLDNDGRLKRASDDVLAAFTWFNSEEAIAQDPGHHMTDLVRRVYAILARAQGEDEERRP